ncbi:MAG: hypothetical protein GW855_07740 [Erythrobacter sp.]|nr:hypothetical protein [Erythrobacter sp.]NCQ62429.1 hypothetical protein [Alphaproteobacteria bacterium]
MRWPTMTFCQACVREGGGQSRVQISNVRMIGYVGSWSVGSLAMFVAQESTDAR